MSLWDQMLPELEREFAEHPNDFLRQPGFKRTMHPNQQTLARAYLEVLRGARNKWVSLSVLRDGRKGKPLQCEDMRCCSPVTIQHAYYLHLMGEHFGDYRQLNFADLGGGYGNMRRVAYEQGHMGVYYLLDFEPMLRVQQAYLGELPRTYFLPATAESLRFAARDDSVLMATFSLNEMPMAQRWALESAFDEFNYLFFAHNRVIDGIDNYAYFDGLAAKLTDFTITFIDDPMRKARFMLGVHK